MAVLLSVLSLVCRSSQGGGIALLVFRDFGLGILFISEKGKISRPGERVSVFLRLC